MNGRIVKKRFVSRNYTNCAYIDLFLLGFSSFPLEVPSQRLTVPAGFLCNWNVSFDAPAMPQLHAFRNDPPLSNFSSGLLSVSSARLPQWQAALHRSGVLSPERQNTSDLELAGVLLGALIEAELIVFLKNTPTSDNARNGYVSRRFHFPQGDVFVNVPRDRSGLFEMHVLKRYSARIRTNVEDLISLAVATGYSPSEKMQLLTAFCRREGGDPRTLKKALPLFQKAVDQWLLDRIPTCVRLAVGWEKTVVHACGIRKRVAGIRVLADDAKTLIGVRAVACDADSDEDLAFPLLQACSKIHGLTVPAAFTTTGTLSSRFAEAAAVFWPGTQYFR